VVLTNRRSLERTGRVPPHAALHAGLQLVPAAWQRGCGGCKAVALLRAGREREGAAGGAIERRGEPALADLSADLGRYAGQRVTIELSATLAGLPPRLRGDNLVAWGPVALTSRSSP